MDGSNRSVEPQYGRTSTSPMVQAQKDQTPSSHAGELWRANVRRNGRHMGEGIGRRDMGHSLWGWCWTGWNSDRLLDDDAGTWRWAV